MAKRDPEDTGFVVNDRRKFTSEGEVRPEAQVQAEAQEKAEAEVKAENSAPPPPVAAHASLPDSTPSPTPVTTSTAVSSEGVDDAGQESVIPLTAEDHVASAEAYRDSNTAFDRAIETQIGADGVRNLAMTFERLLGSLHMTAFMQLGLAYQRGAQPKLDILGARQTIDTMALLAEKTKGNLSGPESEMMQNSLYELRMAYLEVTHALAQQAQSESSGIVGS